VNALTHLQVRDDDVVRDVERRHRARERCAEFEYAPHRDAATARHRPDLVEERALVALHNEARLEKCVVFTDPKHAADACAAHREPQVKSVLLPEHRHCARIVEVAHHFYRDDVVVIAELRKEDRTEAAAP
jgi:hypothetical protein